MREEMTEAKAREKYHLHISMGYTCGCGPEDFNQDCFEARGYLKAIGKAEPLVEVLKIDPFFPQATAEDGWRIKNEFQIKRKETLAQYEREK